MNSKQKSTIQALTGGKFRLHLLKNLPMGLLAGLKIENVTKEACTTSVPFKWLNKNPFKSMYFAVQSMAAELSTATTCLVATLGHQSSIAFIIVDCKAQFLKKATEKVYFTCSDADQAFDAVKKCQESDEAVIKTFKTTGKQKDGTVVAEFEFTWSFKRRSS
ncbi:MAG: DUF4442 domain-containing protein [Cyclobacteriaceae bacterium]